MLRELEVRDLGIIDLLRLQIPAKFSVLTGETGAGKSLLVQSLQLLAGDRADAEQVRGGCERLLVEGCFTVPTQPAAVELLAELGISVDDELVLRREVSKQGRSRAWINDVPVTVGALGRLAPYLISIDGQHEQRGLADPSSHLGIVDAAGGLGGLRGEVAAAYTAWQDVRDQLLAQRQALATRRDRLDVIAFQLQEIEQARLVAGEDEQLREERNLLRHAGRIGELLAQALGALGGEGGAVALARAGRATRELGDLGIGISEVREELEQAHVLAEEAERALLALAERVHPNPEHLEAVESRLALMDRLAKKYGGSAEAVLEHQARLKAERDQLDTVENELIRLEDEENALAGSYLVKASALSRERGKAAEGFAKQVSLVLASLGMPKVKLGLEKKLRLLAKGPMEFDGQPLEPAEDGIDVGEFMISPNPGEEPKPMVRIASGGELSRLHLAMRTVLRDARGDRDPLTVLFDEVDAGIGGLVADELGKLLQQQGKRDQVLVVTHLPQVAAKASAQFVVSKKTQGGRTLTKVEVVSDDKRIDELVRMLGGTADNQTVRAHARQLLGET